MITQKRHFSKYKAFPELRSRDIFIPEATEPTVCDAVDATESN